MNTETKTEKPIKNSMTWLECHCAPEPAATALSGVRSPTSLLHREAPPPPPLLLLHKGARVAAAAPPQGGVAVAAAAPTQGGAAMPTMDNVIPRVPDITNDDIKVKFSIQVLMRIEGELTYAGFFQLREELKQNAVAIKSLFGGGQHSH